MRPHVFSARFSAWDRGATGTTRNPGVLVLILRQRLHVDVVPVALTDGFGGEIAAEELELAPGNVVANPAAQSVEVDDQRRG